MAVLTDLQIEKIEEVIKKHMNKFILMTLGTNHLSTEERKKLSEQGVLDESIPVDDLFKDSYILGKTRGTVNEKLANISYNDFKRQIFNNPVELTERDQIILNHIKEKAGNYITGIRDNMKKVVEGIIRDNNHEVHLDQLNEAIKPAIERAVEESQNIQKLVRELRNNTGDFLRDWQRVAVTELNSAHNQASTEEIGRRNKRKDNDDVLVYCIGPLDDRTCQYCIKFYHDGGSYKIYRLSDLKANGTNYGKKFKDFQAVIPPMHPNCFLDGRGLVYTDKGLKRISKIKIGDMVLTHKKRFKRVYNVIKFSGYKGGYYTIIYKINNKEQRLKITPDHELLVNNQWIQAKDLQIGDKLHMLMGACKKCDKKIIKYSDFWYERNFCCQECGKMYKFETDKTYSEKLSKATSKFNIEKRYKNMTKKEIREKYTKAANKKFNELMKSGDWSPVSEEMKKINGDRLRKINEEKKLTNSCGFQNIEIQKKAKKNWKKISKCQIKLYNLVKTIYKDAVIEYYSGKYFLDIYVPSLKLNIEYDGSYWHRNKEKDYIRDQYLNKQGLYVLRYEDIIPNKKDLQQDIDRILDNHNERYDFEEIEIVDIQYKDYNMGKYLWDISVEDDHSFVIKGIISKNCRHRLVELPQGFTLDENGSPTYVGPEHHEFKNDLTKSENYKKNKK